MPTGPGFAALWDMDGTLVDTAELHFEAWKETCRELEREFTRDRFTATLGRRNPETIRSLSGERFEPADVDRIGDRKEVLYRTAAQRGVAFLPGVRALLESLHQAGWKQAIASSAPHANLDLILRLTASAGLFQAVIGMED